MVAEVWAGLGTARKSGNAAGSPRWVVETQVFGPSSAGVGSEAEQMGPEPVLKWGTPVPQASQMGLFSSFCKILLNSSECKLSTALWQLHLEVVQVFIRKQSQARVIRNSIRRLPQCLIYLPVVFAWPQQPWKRISWWTILVLSVFPRGGLVLPSILSPSSISYLNLQWMPRATRTR